MVVRTVLRVPLFRLSLQDMAGQDFPSNSIAWRVGEGDHTDVCATIPQGHGGVPPHPEVSELPERHRFTGTAHAGHSGGGRSRLLVCRRRLKTEQAGSTGQRNGSL